MVGLNIDLNQTKSTSLLNTQSSPGHQGGLISSDAIRAGNENS